MAFATPNVGKDKYTGYSYEGKQIVLTKRRGYVEKKDYHKNNWLPENKRIEIATLWAVLRNYTEVANLAGVSPSVVKRLKSEPWFQNVVDRVVKEKNDELDKELTGVIHDCARLIKDRLVTGDVRVNFKTGEQYTLPVDARTLATVMGILFDKRQLVRGEATSRTESISFDKRLEHLKEAFEKFSKSTEIEGVYTDVGIQQEESERRQEAENPQALLTESTGGPVLAS
jgi:hypothetical protein